MFERGWQRKKIFNSSDLDDILPTMLVCKQFFAGKHLTILCKDLSGFILGNLKDYSVETCSDLDDILPTMLVCRQFFAGKHLTILCKDLSGFILGNFSILNKQEPTSALDAAQR